MLTDHISQRLAQINAPVDLVFGIFTYGKTKVSKADFKNTLLYQLDLIKEITEAEMDLFLINNDTLKNKNFVTQIDFLKIF